MDAKPKPIPAFYCCYLLRSTVRQASVYVGSTPNPVRRLGQHNGIAKGGAVRTSRLSLRPWEMTCIVSGFTSQVAALQFEWAWQNSHLTRHITSDDRISFPTSRTKISSKTGKPRKKLCRPRTSMKDKLANLHILLRSTYFTKWPLRLRFFNTDVYEAWKRCCKDAIEPLRQDLPIDLDVKEIEAKSEDTSLTPRKRRRKEDDYGKGGIEGLDTTYSRFRDALEKSSFFLVDGELLQCGLCQGSLSWEHDLIATCSGRDCNDLFHLKCLSNHFLRDNEGTHIIPDEGHCPSCNTHLQWQDLMTEMTLRLRSPKQVEKMLSKKNKKDLANAASQQTVAGYLEDEADQETAENGPNADEIARLGDERVEDESDDSDSVMSAVSDPSPKKVRMTKQPERKKRLPSVVEESDWEGAETVV